MEFESPYSDVFISYSRQDKEFARRLFKALENTGRKSWIDWDGLSAGSNWWSGIQKGIESAHNFVFLITPSSLCSPVCQLEIAHARSNGKRIVPIIHKDAQIQEVFNEIDAVGLTDILNNMLGDRNLQRIARDNWRILSEVHWLFFREGDDFLLAFDQLVKTIEIDQQYVKMHTRIGLRAKEWEDAKRDTSFRLIGIDLESAEQWLLDYDADADRRQNENEVPKVPAPTELQRTYITASHREAEQERANTALERRNARLQRRFLTIFGILLLIAIIFAMFAYASQQNADTSRVLAESVARASESISELQRRSEQAIGLSISATSNISDNPEPIISRSLYSVFDHAFIRNILSSNIGRIQAIAWSPDGKYLAAGGANDSVIILDAITFEILGEIQEDVITLAWHPTKPFIVTGCCQNGVMRVWDISGHKIKEFKEILQPINSVAFSPDGSLILTGSGNGPGLTEYPVIGSDDFSARIWDFETGQERKIFPHDSLVRAVAWSPDGQRIVTGSLKGRVWDVLTGDQLLEFSINDTPILSLAWSSDGTRIVTAGDDNQAHVWDASTGNLLSNLIGHQDPIWGVAWDPTNRRIVTASMDRTARIWDAETGIQLWILAGHPNRILSVSWSPDGERIATGGTDGSIRVWTSEPPPPVRILSTEDSRAVEAVAWNPAGDKVVVADFNGMATIWSVKSGQLLQTIVGDHGEISAILWHPFQPWILLGSSSDTGSIITIWDVETAEKVTEITTSVIGDRFFGTRFSLNPNGSLVAILNGSATVTIQDIITGAIVAQIDSTEGIPEAVSWSPDGTYLAIGSWNGDEAGVTQIWDMSKDKPIGGLKLMNDGREVTSVSWKRDGTQLLTSDFDTGNAYVWDVVSGDRICTLFGHVDMVQTAQWNSQGTEILTSSRDKTARIWDSGTCTETRVIEDTGVDLNSIGDVATWSPNGLFILIGGHGGKAQIWLHDRQLFRAELIRRVCTLNRDIMKDLMENFSDWTGCEREMKNVTAQLIEFDFWSPDAKNLSSG